MTLIINNHDVEKLLTMEMTLEALEESYLAAGRQGSRLPAAHRHPHPDQRSDQELPVGHDGGRLDRRLFRHPHEVRRDLRDAIQRRRDAGEILRRARACSAA